MHDDLGAAPWEEDRGFDYDYNYDFGKDDDCCCRMMPVVVVVAAVVVVVVWPRLILASFLPPISMEYPTPSLVHPRAFPKAPHKT